MTLTALLLYTLLVPTINTSKPSLEEVRSLYINADNDESCCNKLIEILSYNEVQSDALLLGYKGCVTMIKAKFVFNPFTKFKYFSKGKSILEKAIIADNNNIELRYLRFTIQTNIPSFLRYHDNINSDKTFLINSIDNITDGQLKQSIVTYLKSSCYVTDNEKQKL